MVPRQRYRFWYIMMSFMYGYNRGGFPEFGVISNISARQLPVKSIKCYDSVSCFHLFTFLVFQQDRCSSVSRFPPVFDSLADVPEGRTRLLHLVHNFSRLGCPEYQRSSPLSWA